MAIFQMERFSKKKIIKKKFTAKTYQSYRKQKLYLRIQQTETKAIQITAFFVHSSLTRNCMLFIIIHIHFIG